MVKLMNDKQNDKFPNRIKTKQKGKFGNIGI